PSAPQARDDAGRACGRARFHACAFNGSGARAHAVGRSGTGSHRRAAGAGKRRIRPLTLRTRGARTNALHARDAPG
ncbi:MAG TPA: hypothetical protein VF752_06525, partial [Thermoleophilaceae bacterium]